MHFAFLVLKEHPYGREMLRILLERGFVPALIVEEDSPVADEERAKFLTRIQGQPVPPTIAELIAGRGIPHEQVPNHNGRRCRLLLEAVKPELVVLGGTRIISKRLLAIPPRGMLNSHPGLLPYLRGSSSVAWAIYKDLPVGSTCHFINAGIDTGPIVLRRELPVYRGESYEHIERRVWTLSGELMAEALALLQAGPVQTIPQDPRVGETLRVIPPELWAEAKRKLAEGRYAHYADEKTG